MMLFQKNIWSGSKTPSPLKMKNPPIPSNFLKIQNLPIPAKFQKKLQRPPVLSKLKNLPIPSKFLNIQNLTIPSKFKISQSPQNASKFQDPALQ